MPLLDRQKKFCEEYMVDCNATQAYLRAGYKCTPSTANRPASRLMSNVDVKAYIAKLRTKQIKKGSITAEEFEKRLDDIYNRCMQLEPELDSEGEPTGKLKFDSAGANRALITLGNARGFFKDDGQESGEITSKDLREARVAINAHVENLIIHRHSSAIPDSGQDEGQEDSGDYTPISPSGIPRVVETDGDNPG